MPWGKNTVVFCCILGCLWARTCDHKWGIIAFSNLCWGYKLHKRRDKLWSRDPKSDPNEPEYPTTWLIAVSHIHRHPHPQRRRLPITLPPLPGHVYEAKRGWATKILPYGTPPGSTLTPATFPAVKAIKQSRFLDKKRKILLGYLQLLSLLISHFSLESWFPLNWSTIMCWFCLRYNWWLY